MQAMASIYDGTAPDQWTDWIAGSEMIIEVMGS